MNWIVAASLWALAMIVRAQPSPAISHQQVWIPMKTKSFFGGERTLKLEATLYKPKGDGPFPLALLSHGSTGGGAIPASMTVRPVTTAPVFLERGFVVLAPMRRGRGASEGTSDEPVSCDSAVNTWAMENAIADTDAALAYARALPFVDASRIILGGQSRGGILSVLYARQRPDVAKAVVNFVGGWTGDRCPFDFNGSVFEKAGASRVPTLWIYAENDRLYAADSIRRYAEAYRNGGGVVKLHLYPPVGNDGHYIGRHPNVWRKDLEAFLDGLGFPRSH